jgi:histidinol-phosphatase (PHP family)
MKTNYHTHTTRCHHAVGSDEEYILSAIKGGYDELGFSDHTPWKYITDYVSPVRMIPDELPGYVDSIRSLEEKYKDQIKVRLGLECEYFPDYIYWLKNTIKEYGIDYVIFGNHFYNSDEKFRYFAKYTDSIDMLDLYEESAVEGIESGLFKYMAHPDLFMNSYPEFDHHCTMISRHICRAAVRNNLPLEYNISIRAKKEAQGLEATVPSPEFWHIATTEGCTAIIGIDAHNNKDFETSKYYDQAVDDLKKMGIKTIDHLDFSI